MKFQKKPAMIRANKKMLHTDTYKYRDVASFFYFIGNSFSYKVKMLRRDATRVELKMHLRAHTGAQRVTR